MVNEYKLYSAMAIAYDLLASPLGASPMILAFPTVGRNEKEAKGLAEIILRERPGRGYLPPEVFTIKVQEEHYNLPGYKIEITKMKGRKDEA